VEDVFEGSWLSLGPLN